MSPDIAVYTLLLFVGIQLIEGYILQPLIEARAVDLAPALVIVIVMQLVFGTLFGFAGVALAAPACCRFGRASGNALYRRCARRSLQTKGKAGRG
jgi:predicted PurR-regulated permease PerM